MLVHEWVKDQGTYFFFTIFSLCFELYFSRFYSYFFKEFKCSSFICKNHILGNKFRTIPNLIIVLNSKEKYEVLILICIVVLILICINNRSHAKIHFFFYFHWLYLQKYFVIWSINFYLLDKLYTFNKQNYI